MPTLARNDNGVFGPGHHAGDTESSSWSEHGHGCPRFGFATSYCHHICCSQQWQRKSHGLEVVDDPRLKSKGLVQFPLINDPGTIGEYATLTLDWTSNSKYGFADFNLPTMIFQEKSSRVRKSRETRHVKACDGAQCAVR